ncbi:hypothetical protein LAB1_33200 [Roseibium sp. LAB1]
MAPRWNPGRAPFELLTCLQAKRSGHWPVWMKPLSRRQHSPVRERQMRDWFAELLEITEG